MRARRFGGENCIVEVLYLESMYALTLKYVGKGRGSNILGIQTFTVGNPNMSTDAQQIALVIMSGLLKKDIGLANTYTSNCRIEQCVL